MELKTLQERLDIDKQHWEENYKKKEVCCIHVHSIYTRACLSSVEGRGPYHSHWVTLRKTCLGFQVQLSNTRDKCQEEMFSSIMCGKVRGWQGSS